MSYIASWSGGKDSCFACYEATRQGYEISHLVNFISQEFQRVSFHGTEAKLRRQQAIRTVLGWWAVTCQQLLDGQLLFFSKLE